jgi:O-antigen/teichoic acid export membrane protein
MGTFVKLIYERMYALRGELYWVVTGQAIALVGGFTSIKILTNIMSPEGYGKLALGLAIAGMMNTLIFGPIGQVVMRFYAICDEKEGLNIYFGLLKKIHSFVILALIVFSIMVAGIIYYKIGSEWAFLIITASFFGIISGVNNTYITLQGAVRQRKIAALHQGMDVWLRTAFAVAFIFIFRNTAYVTLLGFFLGTLIVTVSQIRFSLQNEKIRLNWNIYGHDEDDKRKIFLQFISYGGQFFALAAFAAVSMYADRWILQGMNSTYEVGIYAAAFQIANAPIALLTGVIYQFILPIIFQRAGTMATKEQIESSSRLLKITIIGSSIMLLLIVVFTYFWSALIMRVLTTPAFAQYNNMLWIMALGLSFFHVAQIIFIKAQTYNKPKIILTAWIYRTASFLILGIVLASKHGVYGMATAFCLGAGIFLVAVAVATNKLELATAS